MRRASCLRAASLCDAGEDEDSGLSARRQPQSVSDRLSSVQALIKEAQRARDKDFPMAAAIRLRKARDRIDRELTELEAKVAR